MSKEFSIIRTMIKICILLSLASCFTAKILENPPSIQMESCVGVCGVKRSSPCSCHYTCFILGSCCDRISSDCPIVAQEAADRYGGIYYDDLSECDIDGLFYVSSCPKRRIVKSSMEENSHASLNTDRRVFRLLHTQH